MELIIYRDFLRPFVKALVPLKNFDCVFFGFTHSQLIFLKRELVNFSVKKKKKNVKLYTDISTCTTNDGRQTTKIPKILFLKNLLNNVTNFS